MSEELKKIVQEKIHKCISNFELTSKSTNQLYSFECENERFVLKTPNISLSNLSPFWRQLRFIFDSDFITQAENVTSLVRYLSQNPHIKIPKVIYTNTKEKVIQIFEHMEGSAYEPDEFPSTAEISYQLGQYIGWIHSHKFQGYGVFSDDLRLKSSSQFVEQIVESMNSIIQEYWSLNPKVLNFYRNIESVVPDEPGFFSLIMPDISGNQFIYSKDLKRINAVVDIDAYVIGSVNLELTVLEMCLTDFDSFQKGYEQYCKLPPFKSFRSFYRFFMYINDYDNPIDLDEFLNTHIFFS